MTAMHRLSLLLLLALLNGCGGGSSSNPAVTPVTPVKPGDPQPPVTPVTPVPPVSPGDPVPSAMSNGDPRGLSPAHRDTLLQRATAMAEQVKIRQANTLRNIYGDAPLDLTLNHGTSTSSSIEPRSKVLASALITSDGGAGMAAVAGLGTGRALAYGADVLNWMANKTKEQQHYPLFARAVQWLITGDANSAPPATVKFISTGYNAATVKALLLRMGMTGEEVKCDVTVANTCANDAVLLVFGGGTAHTAGLADRVQDYMRRGQAVLYMHPNWGDSAGGRQVLRGLGMELGDYPGNYFESQANVSVGAGRTLAATLAKADKMGALETTLRMLANDALAQDFKANPGLLAAVDQVHDDLAAFHAQGSSVFKSDGGELYGMLVLWADLWRPNVDYAQLSKGSTPIQFLRAYASDSWLTFNRRYTTTNPGGQGDYMPVAAQSLPVSTQAETLEIVLPQASGVTAIGRGAVPAKGVLIELAEPLAGVQLEIQTSHLRSWGNVLEDYRRPRRPHSFALPVPVAGKLDFVSPSGGPLYLRYSGATPGAVVKLRLTGTTRYAHFDFSATPNEAEITDAVAALKRKDFGWQTAKMVGGEIQQTIDFAVKAIGERAPRDYVVTRLKNMIFDTNHMANGYANIPTPARVQTVCDALTWTCGGDLHRAPSVQHFVGWIAKCGYLCSGNPSDGYAPLDIGWGWAHELGHNTVQRVMHMEFNGVGCVVECDNNILAATQMMRVYDVLKENTSGDRVSYNVLYQYVKENRALGLAPEAQRADMEKRLWGGTDSAKLAVHFQLAFLYTKVRYGMAQPTSDATIDFYTLLTKGDRLVAKEWSAANAARYGMGRYTSNTITNHDLLFTLSSTIIGRDLRKVFAMYGLPLSQTALDSVADLKLPVAPAAYYALGAGKANQLATGVWLDLETGTPAYPF